MIKAAVEAGPQASALESSFLLSHKGKGNACPSGAPASAGIQRWTLNSIPRGRCPSPLLPDPSLGASLPNLASPTPFPPHIYFPLAE